MKNQEMVLISYTKIAIEIFITNNTLKKTTKRVGVILYVSIVYGNGLTKMIYFQRKEVNND